MHQCRAAADGAMGDSGGSSTPASARAWCRGRVAGTFGAASSERVMRCGRSGARTVRRRPGGCPRPAGTFHAAGLHLCSELPPTLALVVVRGPLVAGAFHPAGGRGRDELARRFPQMLAQIQRHCLPCRVIRSRRQPAPGGPGFGRRRRGRARWRRILSLDTAWRPVAQPR
jgi:hypothetical protein